MAPVFDYVIVGGGLAGASAIEGIRERDKDGSILLVSEELHLPYDRPPLSKKLWFGQMLLHDVFLHDQSWYDSQGVTLKLDHRAEQIDPVARTVTADGSTFGYRRLLLATGCKPRRLPIHGGDLPGLSYFRTLDDYMKLVGAASAGKSALVIGGGFIGSEIAAALNYSKLEVTMMFPEALMCSRVFPEDLAHALQHHFAEKGVRILANEKPMSISREGNKYVTRTGSRLGIETDLVVVGVGVAPDLTLAQTAGLEVGNGIVVNEFMQTSNPDIYAAGDNAFFPYQVLGQSMRIEHWDQAFSQGKAAGRNMAGAGESYDYQPYFYSDLFEFGYEATGEVNSSLETFADWEEEFRTGVIYYLREGRVRGVMMCNVWDKMKAARELVRSTETVTPAQLRGRIRSTD